MAAPAETGKATAAAAPGPIVTVRYWASARAAAGRVQDTVPAATVAAALAAVRELHAGEPRFGRILGISSVLVGDRPLGTTDPATVSVTTGDVVEILPPFAGG